MSTSKDAVTDVPSATRRIRALEKRLADAKQDLVDYRKFVGERLNLSHLADATDDSSSSAALPRDDDSHYFQSYNENGKYPFNFFLLVCIFRRNLSRHPCYHDTRQRTDFVVCSIYHDEPYPLSRCDCTRCWMRDRHIVPLCRKIWRQARYCRRCE